MKTKAGACSAGSSMPARALDDFLRLAKRGAEIRCYGVRPRVRRLAIDVTCEPA